MLPENVVAIDHIAVAVPDLDAAVAWAQKALGCELVDARDTHGKTSGMKSAVMRLGGFTLVFVQGTDKTSQVTEFVDKCGPGVQHIALRVNNLAAAIASLQSKGVEFATPLLEDNAAGLAQIFTVRDPSTGLMLEFIQRSAGTGFSDKNVTKLFESLEERKLY
jgi:methylmalonyl-CoA/ethylmalonyl-CoA epimerase